MRVWMMMPMAMALALGAVVYTVAAVAGWALAGPIALGAFWAVAAVAAVSYADRG